LCERHQPIPVSPEHSPLISMPRPACGLMKKTRRGWR
jgi:hypothetical protein